MEQNTKLSDRLAGMLQDGFFRPLTRPSAPIYIDCADWLTESADGMGNFLHRRLFLVETNAEVTRRLREPSYPRDLIQDPIKAPACFPWHEVKKVEHYGLEVNALAEPMESKENPPPCREKRRLERQPCQP